VRVLGSIAAVGALLASGAGGVAARPAATPSVGQIAFVLGRGISVINADGSGLRRVTNPKRNVWDESVAWSPDGSQLAFVHTDGETCGLPCISVETIRSDGTGRPTAWGQTGAPRWSPDGTRLASTEFFGVNVAGSATMSLEVADVRSGRSRVLAPRRGGRTGLLRFGYAIDHYAWSPDGTRLCFSRAVGSHVRLALVGADGSALRLLSAQEGLSDCEWAPDATRIVASGGRRIYSISVADGVSTPLTEPAVRVAAPVWSPDGTEIAFLRRDVGGDAAPSDLWTMAADGSAQKLVAADVSKASWSPDGTELAFITPAPRGTAHAARARGLWVTRLDGSPPVELAGGATDLDWHKPR
jgi:Tol biopolymer transport system component